jgi:hypothetical protein
MRPSFTQFLALGGQGRRMLPECLSGVVTFIVFFFSFTGRHASRASIFAGGALLFLYSYLVNI